MQLHIIGIVLNGKCAMQHDQPSIAHTPIEYVSLFPRPPHLTSFATQWQGISVITMQQSAYELPEVSIPLDGVGIFTSSNLSERTIDGCSKSESTNVGDIVVVPANIGHSQHQNSDTNTTCPRETGFPLEFF